MSQFKSLASSGKGLVGVILPDTTSSTRYVSFDQPYLQNRYLYAIGGNPEAARRAGVNLARIRTIAFALCAATAGAAGLLYLSLLDGMSNNVPGGQYVLYAVAAAVIGGTSLFGGRGKVIHGVIGGLVIGAIANGMGLLGLDVQVQFIVTGLVLLVAVTIDALSRRAATSGSAARA
ncbi:MAG: ABC transporter permease subunit [Candidatus Dormibacteria bacterium]